jgi:hypothetical protein
MGKVATDLVLPPAARPRMAALAPCGTHRYADLEDMPASRAHFCEPADLGSCVRHLDIAQAVVVIPDEVPPRGTTRGVAVTWWRHARVASDRRGSDTLCRELAGRLLRIGEPAVHRDLEDTAAGPAQIDLRGGLGLQDRVPRRTGARFVASHSAVFDLDLHARGSPGLWTPVPGWQEIARSDSPRRTP